MGSESPVLVSDFRQSKNMTERYVSKETRKSSGPSRGESRNDTIETQNNNQRQVEVYR